MLGAAGLYTCKALCGVEGVTIGYQPLQLAPSGVPRPCPPQPIKLALALKGADFDMVDVDRDEMKTDL